MKKVLCIALTLLFCFSSILTVSADEVKWLVKPQYDQIYASDENGDLIHVMKDDKYGYIDKNGKVIIDFVYDYATSFSKGMAYVEKNGVFSYIDKNGKVLFNLEAKNYLNHLKNTDADSYIFGSKFSGDYAVITSETSESFIIDRAGKYVPVPEGIAVLDYNISNNIAIIQNDDSSEVGYLNIKTGKTLFSPYDVSEFENGYGIVYYGDGNIGIVNENLEYVNKSINVGDVYASLSNGIIYIAEYDEDYEPIKAGYIDLNGKTLIPSKYLVLGDYEDGLIAANIFENGVSKVGYLDIKGNWVIKPMECSAYSGFINGVAAFSKTFDENTYSDNFGLIDKTGKFVIEPQFEDFAYDDNYAYAKVNDLWGVLDISGFSNNSSSDIKFNSNDMPDSWAIDEVTKSIKNNLVPIALQNKYKEKITRKEFCDLAISLIESISGKKIDAILSEKGLSITDNPFSDTTDKNVVAANKLSIVNGKGNGLFDPNGYITRQEAAAMLTNTAKALGIDINSKETEYADSKNIDTWAKNAVNYVSSNNVMKGNNTGFDPKGSYTRQQAYLTIFRLFDTIKK